jgi:hypothetical protein
LARDGISKRCSGVFTLDALNLAWLQANPDGSTVIVMDFHSNIWGAIWMLALSLAGPFEERRQAVTDQAAQQCSANQTG